ncbi:7492_t:CDS:2, partial [Funneliformis geosporum]
LVLIGNSIYQRQKEQIRQQKITNLQACLQEFQEQTREQYLLQNSLSTTYLAQSPVVHDFFTDLLTTYAEKLARSKDLPLSLPLEFGGFYLDENIGNGYREMGKCSLENVIYPYQGKVANISLNRLYLLNKFGCEKYFTSNPEYGDYSYLDIILENGKYSAELAKEHEEFAQEIYGMIKQEYLDQKQEYNRLVKERTSIPGTIHGELTGDCLEKGFYNPILLIHPACDCYRSFDTFVGEPYVKSNILPIRTETYTSQEEYVVSYATVNYIGGGKYIETYTAERTRKHYPTDPDNHLKPLDIVKVNEGSYDHVGIYLEKFHEGDGTITRYHPIIPFKEYGKIVRELAYAIEDNFRSNCYCPANHFGKVNNGKDSTIKLVDEINEVNNILGYTSSRHQRAKEIATHYLQEVPPKEN